ncbi:MAG: molybdopterin-dependent oxidoreductase [bacterium]
MTNTWNDIGTSDVILVIGGNPAENHPMAFRHITNALENKYGNTGPDGNGAKLIVVDPRFTRTASKASIWNGKQMYCKMRSGTDIVFVNGMINYVIQNKKYDQPYVLNYSNAGFLINENFRGPAETGDGRFSGFIPDASQPVPALGQIGKYDKSSWDYAKFVSTHATKAFLAPNIATDFWDGSGNCTCGTSCGFSKDTLSLDPESPSYLGKFRQHLLDTGILNAADMGPNVANQRTVWEHVLLHYARYDKNTVINLTGADSTVYDDICELFSITGEQGKAGTILYAMGTTQHTVGTQNIRAYSTLQILLGNMGKSGGGINAQRGESNVQGSTDFALLFHILPGYLGQPDGTIPGDAWFDRTDPGIGEPGHPLQLPSYVKRNTPFKVHQNELNWWSNFKKYIVSLMKCYWWNALPPTNDPVQLRDQLQAVYDWIPKIPGNCSHMQLFEDMLAGTIKGLLAFGTNPAVGGPNSVKEREALRNLDWLVISEIWENETAAFWQYSTTGQPLTSAEMAAINTEVFLLPAAAHMEKEGFVVNSSRWAQTRYKAVEPPGDAEHEILMINKIFDACKAAGANDYGMTHLTMGSAWYGGTADPPIHILDLEINGLMSDGVTPVPKFADLKDDCTTSSGCWVYCGMYPSIGNNLSRRRNNTQAPGMAPVYSQWAWAWPVNRRIIYNGASLVPCGFGGVTETPADSSHKVIWWNGTAWTGDVMDGVANPHGYAGHTERSPFIMRNEGHARLHGMGMAEGPYPEHYEPLDTPLAGRGQNPVPYGAGHAQLINPCIKIYEPDKIGTPNNYPIIGTTYRVSEHWQAGAATRHLPWLCELVPDVVVEMSMDLARSKGINNGDWVKITTMRGYMKARALVTNRFKTFRIFGETRHEIGVWWHWGYKGIKTGHSANRLTPHVGDANTRIPEYKAFLCKIEKV